MRALLDLYVETGEPRFLEPIPKALKWAENSLLPGNRLARFYELKTNKPLYFNAPRQYSNLPAPAFPDLKDYTLIYEDTDLPNHYSFQGSGEPVRLAREYYNRITEKGRDSIIADRARIPDVDPARVREIINSLDKEDRWVEMGRLKTNDRNNPYIQAEIISCRTFNQNMTLLTNYIRNNKN
jgi:(2Fe-2S) ferredoxin